MAITLKKKAQTPEAEVSVKEAVDQSDLVEQFLANYKEIAKLAPQIKKLTDKLKPLKDMEKNLLGQIEALNTDKPEDDGYTADGVTGYIEFGPKGTERKITDIKFIQKRMGNDVFYSLAKVNLGDVDKYLTAAEREKCLKTDRTPRSHKVGFK